MYASYVSLHKRTLRSPDTAPMSWTVPLPAIELPLHWNLHGEDASRIPWSGHLRSPQRTIYSPYKFGGQLAAPPWPRLPRRLRYSFLRSSKYTYPAGSVLNLSSSGLYVGGWTVQTVSAQDFCFVTSANRHCNFETTHMSSYIIQCSNVSKWKPLKREQPP